MSSLMYLYLSVKIWDTLVQYRTNISHLKMTRFADRILSHNYWEGWQQQICKWTTSVTWTENYSFHTQGIERPSTNCSSTRIRLSSRLILTPLSLTWPRISPWFSHVLLKILVIQGWHGSFCTLLPPRNTFVTTKNKRSHPRTVNPTGQKSAIRKGT